ncbi:MAG: toprim domain-containing protein [Ekhidna sp.]|nr:toprim domain-containing protein [Ekhidna sp.]
MGPKSSVPIHYDFRDFKRHIDLTHYATSLGYKVDSRKSTTHAIVMSLDKADKIIISKKDGIWVYFSVYEDGDHGTIIDFIKNRTDKSVYTIGQELQSWLAPEKILPDLSVSKSHESVYDPERLHHLFNQCTEVNHYSYLSMRGLTPSLLQSPRFSGRVLQDHFRNVVFPHFKEGRVCGLELKNEHLHLFIRGSEKTFWRSNYFKDDTTLLIAESPIDAMSYQALHNLTQSFYLATCGGFSRKQQVWLQRLIKQLPNISATIIITDQDHGGDRIAHQVARAFKDMSNPYKGTIKRHSPEQRGDDWNDVLKQQVCSLTSK